MATVERPPPAAGEGAAARGAKRGPAAGGGGSAGALRGQMCPGADKRVQSNLNAEGEENREHQPAVLPEQVEGVSRRFRQRDDAQGQAAQGQRPEKTDG